MTKPKTVCRFISVCLLAVLLLCLLPVPTLSATSGEIREEIDELERQEQELTDQLEQLEQQRIENAQQITDLIAEKQVLDQQISLLYQQVTTIEQKVDAIKQLVADKQDQVDHALANYEALKEASINRIRIMEENGSISYWSILFHAQTLADFLDRVNMIEEIAASDRERLEELRIAAQQVTEAKDILAKEQQNLAQTLEKLAAEQAAMEQKREESNAILLQLVAKGEEFERLIDEGELEQQKLLERIAQMEDKFDRVAFEEWLAAQPKPEPEPEPEPPKTEEPKEETPKEEEPKEEEPKEEEPKEEEPKEEEPKEEEPKEEEPKEEEKPQTPAIKWVVPVPYYTLTSPFGMRLHPIYGDYRMHNGIDMACAEGTPIYATRAGQVEIAQWSNTAGYYVQINHGDGYRSVYMHMTHYVVSRGQFVNAGQVIGYVGNTGASKGNHLHFGVSLNGTYINPYPLIR